MKILILGIGNILFGDEGIGAHLANYLDEKYDFVSQEHTVDIVDGGTLAQLLIPTITQYEYIILIDCVNTDDGKIGDVYFFDFEAVPENITWQGSAHEVEMLQTLQMIQLMDDLPPTKIVGVVPYVIGENSTFEMTDEVMKASVLMEDIIIKHLASLGVKSNIKKNCLLEDIAKLSYKRGI
ncbi:hydrogenase expression/formation protein HydD [Sulfurovum sp. enrichment culture clone C5]|uniref:Hydrogenase expression/formation protein HydD n=1 Tax=Sulfurovum sp. enrichment culture clone C5 TaxID=497650 RepID=A0A0S4XN34_9BACT|nr:hydrogenase expression/formation protein HydD [Sulfurovum sp. enrichment culture clone C5]